MTEQELRGLVREAIAARAVGEAGQLLSVMPAPIPHPSHGRFVLASSTEANACVIEPSVACNHCGYCKSYGH